MSLLNSESTWEEALPPPVGSSIEFCFGCRPNRVADGRSGVGVSEVRLEVRADGSDPGETSSLQLPREKDLGGHGLIRGSSAAPGRPHRLCRRNGGRKIEVWSKSERRMPEFKQNSDHPRLPDPSRASSAPTKSPVHHSLEHAPVRPSERLHIAAACMLHIPLPCAPERSHAA